MKTGGALHNALQKFLSVTLSCALCLSFCGPCRAWADDLRAASADEFEIADESRSDSSSGGSFSGSEKILSVLHSRIVSEVALAAQASTAQNLNELWAAQSGGTDSPYIIAQPGTYALKADLETRGMLSITAKEGEVTILLQGHTFTCRELAVGAAVRAGRNTTVVIDGTTSKGKSAIVYEGGMTPVAIRTEAQSITLTNVDVKAHTDDAYNSLTRFDARGVHVVSGNLKMESCTVDVDLTNQSNASVDASKFLKGSPSGIYLEQAVSSALIENCSVTCTNSPFVVRSSYTDATAGYAYGLYSMAKDAVTVRGGSWTAICARGSAAAMRLAAADLQAVAAKAEEQPAPIKMSVGAGVLAAGIQGTASSGVKLDAPLEIDVIEEYAPETGAALYASADNAFVFEAGFSVKEKATVLVDVANGVPNDTGAVVGALPFATASTESQRVLGLLENACGPSAPTYPALEGLAIVFELDDEKAPVAIAADDGQEIKRYSSLPAATAALEDGQAVRLLADADEITFSPALVSGAYGKTTASWNGLYL